jgi:hypothetical protein
LTNIHTKNAHLKFQNSRKKISYPIEKKIRNFACRNKSICSSPGYSVQSYCFSLLSTNKSQMNSRVEIYPTNRSDQEKERNMGLSSQRKEPMHNYSAGTSTCTCCVGVGGDGHNTMGAGSSHGGALAAFGDGRGRGYREGEDLAEARGDGTLRRLGVPCA